MPFIFNNLLSKTMRKLHLTTILVLGIMLASCGSKGKTEENSIVGKWELQFLTTDIKTSDQEATDKIRNVITQHENEAKGNTVEFTNDGKITDGEESASYSISGNKLTVKADGERNNLTEFKINGDTLSMMNDYIEENFFDEDMRESLGIGKDVKIEKVVLTTNFIRKK